MLTFVSISKRWLVWICHHIILTTWQIISYSEHAWQGCEHQFQLSFKPCLVVSLWLTSYSLFVSSFDDRFMNLIWNLGCPPHQPARKAQDHIPNLTHIVPGLIIYDLFPCDFIHQPSVATERRSGHGRPPPQPASTARGTSGSQVAPSTRPHSVWYSSFEWCACWCSCCYDLLLV